MTSGQGPPDDPDQPTERRSGADDAAASAVEAVWDDLLEDLAATAEEYQADGWETLSLHPGDVTALPGEYGDRVGLDVLVPDDEYRELERWFDAGLTVNDYEVYRTAVGGVVLLLVVLRDEGDRRAVLYPAFYDVGEGRVHKLLETAVEDGALHTYLRRLTGDYVELRHDDPELFAPPDGADPTAGGDTPDLDGPTDDGPPADAAGGDDPDGPLDPEEGL